MYLCQHTGTQQAVETLSRTKDLVCRRDNLDGDGPFSPIRNRKTRVLRGLHDVHVCTSVRTSKNFCSQYYLNTGNSTPRLPLLQLFKRLAMNFSFTAAILMALSQPITATSRARGARRLMKNNDARSRNRKSNKGSKDSCDEIKVLLLGETLFDPTFCDHNCW